MSPVGKQGSEDKFVLEGIFIVPSHFSTEIQLADMVAGSIHRWFAHSNDRFYKQVSGRVRTNQNGKAQGATPTKLLSKNSDVILKMQRLRLLHCVRNDRAGFVEDIKKN